MASSCVNKLVSLCCQKPFDGDQIKRHIAEYRMTGKDVTRAAIQLCSCGMFEHSDHLCQHRQAPAREEPLTYDWLDLLDIFIENGLDAALVLCDNGMNGENIMQSLYTLDHCSLGPVLLKKLLENGADPNQRIDSVPFFEEIDSDFIIDIGMGLFPTKALEELHFRFWLVLVGFGGKIKGGKCPVEMRTGYTPEIFREFERFDYRIEYRGADWSMCIYCKESGKEVAVIDWDGSLK